MGVTPLYRGGDQIFIVEVGQIMQAKIVCHRGRTAIFGPYIHMYEVEINGQLRTTASENVMFKTQPEAQAYIDAKKQ